MTLVMDTLGLLDVGEIVEARLLVCKAIWLGNDPKSGQGQSQGCDSKEVDYEVDKRAREASASLQSRIHQRSRTYA